MLQQQPCPHTRDRSAAAAAFSRWTGLRCSPCAALLAGEEEARRDEWVEVDLVPLMTLLQLPNSGLNLTYHARMHYRSIQASTHLTVQYFFGW